MAGCTCETIANTAIACLVFKGKKKIELCKCLSWSELAGQLSPAHTGGLVGLSHSPIYNIACYIAKVQFSGGGCQTEGSGIREKKKKKMLPGRNISAGLRAVVSSIM